MSGLQKLIDLCEEYSRTWRFNFGLAKPKCTIAGKSSLQNEPRWFSGTDQIQKVEAMDVLSICFSAITE